MKVVIIGAGGHGRVVLDILRNNHQFDIVGFIDSNTAAHHRTVDGIEIIGDLSLIPRFTNMGIGGAIVAIGDNHIRNNYAQTVENAGVNLVNAIHPSANIADNANIGKNVVIAAGASICTHVTIEDSTIFNTGCIIDHESIIQKAAHICPGVKLAGHVHVKPSAFVGIGATIVQGVTIGQSAVVGAGAVVLHDVPAYSTVVGVPAYLVKQSHLPSSQNKLQPSTADLEPAKSLITKPLRRRPTPVHVESQP